MASIANYSFVYYIPTVSKRVSENAAFLTKLWNLAISIRTSFSLFLALISLMVTYYAFPQYLMIWVLSLPLLIPKILNPNLFCNALEINKYVFLIGFLSKLLFLILIYISDNSLLVNCFFAISELIAILLWLKKIHVGLFRIHWISFSEVIRFLRETFNLFLVNFFSLLKPHSILPLVSYVLGNEFAALFALAEKVINVIKGISGTMFVSFFPIYNKQGFKRNSITVKNSIIVVLTFTLSVVVVWFVSPYIIYYLNDFTSNSLATKTLQILSLSIPVFFIIIPLFSYLLQAKQWNPILYFAIVQLLVLVVALYFLMDQNIIGVAKSLVIAEYALLACYVIFVINRTGDSKKLI